MFTEGGIPFTGELAPRCFEKVAARTSRAFSIYANSGGPEAEIKARKVPLIPNLCYS
jgi:hypothetical protein